MALASIFEKIVGPEANIAFHAYDGSKAGPDGADIMLEVKSPIAVAYLAQAPGELGLARAYVSGHIDVHGDLYTLLDRMWNITTNDLTPAEKLAAVRALGVKPLLMRVPPPPQEVRRSTLARLGSRHAKRRDAEAIHHHYDVSNRFYRWVLGPSMAYTCAVYPSDTATLEEAQFAKFDLVARKLDLKPGMRLLDVGCGWGSLAIHAAREYGVRVLGITLSAEQADYAHKQVADAGLADRVEIRIEDYRDLDDGPFDAIASVGMAEHVGTGPYRNYAAVLHAQLKPGGRLLNHQIARLHLAPKEPNRRTFIDAYVFPDGELAPVGTTITLLEEAGFEVRDVHALREHYARTLRTWVANLEADWSTAVHLTSPGRARVWRLYMAASALAFEQARIGVNQILAVKPHRSGASDLPPTRDHML